MNSTRLVILSTAILRSKLVSKSAFLALIGDFLTRAISGFGAEVYFLNDDSKLIPPFFLVDAYASLAYYSACNFYYFSFSYLARASLFTLAWITALVNALEVEALSFFGLLSSSLDIPEVVARRASVKDNCC